MRSSQPTPMFVIDHCSSDDGGEKPRKPSKQLITAISHSWSLPNCNETYKDLCGAIHHTLSNRLYNILKRSRSYPNNCLLTYLKSNEKNFYLNSLPTSMHCNMNLLDPIGGTQTPGGLSSRYSRCGSFFDMSESGYCPPSDQRYIKPNDKLLTIGGHPLLIADPLSTRPSSNNYQDKCTDWLQNLNTNPT